MIGSVQERALQEGMDVCPPSTRMPATSNWSSSMSDPLSETTSTFTFTSTTFYGNGGKSWIGNLNICLHKWMLIIFKKDHTVCILYRPWKNIIIFSIPNQFYIVCSILKIALFIFYTSNNTVSKVKIIFHDCSCPRHSSWNISNFLDVGNKI